LINQQLIVQPVEKA